MSRRRLWVMYEMHVKIKFSTWEPLSKFIDVNFHEATAVTRRLQNSCENYFFYVAADAKQMKPYNWK